MLKSGDEACLDEFKDKVFLGVSLDLICVFRERLLFLYLALDKLPCRNLLLQVSLSEYGVIERLRVNLEQGFVFKKLALGR